MEKNFSKARYIAVTAILSAVATILMYLEFSVPFVPSFIKLDLSETPALIASFAVGPWSGVLVCLVKNILHLPVTSTSCVGELSNFILGAIFVMTAGLIYKHKKTRANAIWGAVLGAALMAGLSILSNYYITYPIYTKFMPMQVILEMYKVFVPSITNLWQALAIINVPFTFVKGLISTLITLVLYKHLSYFIKNFNPKKAKKASPTAISNQPLDDSNAPTTDNNQPLDDSKTPTTVNNQPLDDSNAPTTDNNQPLDNCSNDKKDE